MEWRRRLRPDDPSGRRDAWVSRAVHAVDNSPLDVGTKVAIHDRLRRELFGELNLKHADVIVPGKPPVAAPVTPQARTEMRKLRYNVATSLDGFIAGPDGEYDWIVEDPTIDFAALFAEFDAALVGRRTFEALLAQGTGGVLPGVRTVVFSRTLRAEDYPAVTVVGDGAEAAVATLKAGPGKDLWLFGGGVLFRTLLDAGLVDAVEVAVVPVLLGGGVPVLAPGPRSPVLRLTGSEALPSGIVRLSYAVGAD